jgi:hypothetical protein
VASSASGWQHREAVWPGVTARGWFKSNGLLARAIALCKFARVYKGRVERQKRQGSQARRRVEIHGLKVPKFGNCGRVFDQLIEILGPRRGAFRPIRIGRIFPPECTFSP